MMFLRLAMLGLLGSLSVSGVANAKALPNHVKQLHASMRTCEAKAKKYSDMGYLGKANKQVLECKKIKNEIAKIKVGQKNVDRKIASLDSKPAYRSAKKSKKHKKKHHAASSVQ